MNNLIKDFDLIITNHCNTRCKYCWMESFNTASMSDEFIDDVIAYIKNHKYKHPNFRVTLMGGEPLLFPSKVIKIMQSLPGVKFLILTNGFCKSKEEILSILLPFKDRLSIQVSFDYINNAYDERHQQGDAYDLAKLLYQNGFDVKHNGVITKKNINEYSSLCKEILETLGRVHFGILLNTDGYNNNDYYKLMSEIEEFSDWYFEQIKNGKEYYHRLLLRLFYGKSKYACDGSLKIMTIRWDGKIFIHSTHALRKDHEDCGTIYDNVDDVYNKCIRQAEYFGSFKKNTLLKNKQCSSCSNNNICEMYSRTCFYKPTSTTRMTCKLILSYHLHATTFYNRIIAAGLTDSVKKIINKYSNY